MHQQSGILPGKRLYRKQKGCFQILCGGAEKSQEMGWPKGQMRGDQVLIEVAA